MEVIKQFLDCAQLIKEVNSFDEVLKTYRKIYKNEIQYRGINASLEDCLMDTFNASLAIYTRGGINKKEFEYLLRGIKKISQHVFGFTINGETAYLYAADVMLACACLIKNISYLNVEEQDIFTKKSLKVVNKTKKLNKEAFNKVAAAIRLLGLDKE